MLAIPITTAVITEAVEMMTAMVIPADSHPEVRMKISGRTTMIILEAQITATIAATAATDGIPITMATETAAAVMTDGVLITTVIMTATPDAAASEEAPVALGEPKVI